MNAVSTMPRLIKKKIKIYIICVNLYSREKYCRTISQLHNRVKQLTLCTMICYFQKRESF